jgi:hypothetical protein
MAQPRNNIENYTPQELYQIKQGFEGEITTLGQSMNQLRFALEKYEEGKRSIRAIEECREDEELLMPLSNSLYIQGYLNNRGKVYSVLYRTIRYTSWSTEQAFLWNAVRKNLLNFTTERST